MTEEEQESLSRESVKAARGATRKVNPAEALGEAARRQKRNLLAWSGLAILAQHYHLSIKTVPYFNVELPPGSTGAAAAIIAVPLIYSLIAFMVYAAADLTTWRAGASGDFMQSQWNMVERLGTILWAIQAHVDPTHRNPNLPLADSVRVIEQANREAIPVLKGMQQIRVSMEAVSRLKAWTAFGWELALTLLIAFWAFIVVAPALTLEIATWLRP